jgi:hypothetical protein
MVARTFSLAPGAATSTRSMTQRSSFLRSALVVAGACHSAGMSRASRSMAARSSAVSRAGRDRVKR